VVIAILSVLSVGSALLVTRSSTAPGSDVAALRAGHDLMRSLAVHGQVLRGMYITTRGRRMAERVDGIWQPTGPELRWRNEVRFNARISPTSPALPGTPEIVFFPNGQSLAFEALFGAGESRTRCRSDGWTGLQCEAL